MQETECLNVVLETVEPFVANEVSIDADSKLLEEGLIESINMISILLALEAKLGISLSPADMSFDDFKSCRSLSAVLWKRLSSS